MMAALTGLTGCAASDAAFCADTYTGVIERLRAGLEAHPETHADVGEPATDAVLGHEAGCAVGL